uniref:Uncharacterized protein n=1 Tax=Anopheles maculatus TaxID=74869 RepID=A0A182SU35_9DIPT
MLVEPPVPCSFDIRRSTGIRDGGVIGFASGFGGFFETIGGLAAITGGKLVPFCCCTAGGARSAAVGGSGAFSVISVTKPPFVREGMGGGPLLSSRRPSAIELRCGGCGGSEAATTTPTPFVSFDTGSVSALVSGTRSVLKSIGGGASNGSSKSSSVCRLKSSFSSSIITIEEGCDSVPTATPSSAVEMVTMLSAVRENLVIPVPPIPFSVIEPVPLLPATVP